MYKTYKEILYLFVLFSHVVCIHKNKFDKFLNEVCHFNTLSVEIKSFTIRDIFDNHK